MRPSPAGRLVFVCLLTEVSLKAHQAPNCSQFQNFVLVGHLLIEHGPPITLAANDNASPIGTLLTLESLEQLYAGEL